jgi:O-antigen ligase
MYQFAEKPGHWVMFPFFKDHTIYGAIVALVLPFAVGLYYLEKRNLLLRTTLIFLFIIIVLGLIFSYTRAAWLSVFAAIFLCLLVFFRVKLYLMAGGLVVAVLIVIMNWSTIQMELERNKKEHTTENIDERLQSATNVSTDASNLERINRWDCAISMFKERPLVGFGPGTYMFEYARFQDPENLTIISTNFGNLGNAHSEYLGALSEMGLPGALLFLILVLTIFVVNIQLIYKWPQEDKANRILLMTFLFSFTTYFSHAFLNNYLDTDKAAVPIWGMSAMLIAMTFQLKENLLPSKPE